jgi:nucleotide-binding universal stress UspA family protein
MKDKIDIARSLDRYLKHINHSFHFRKFDDVEEGLLDFAKELNIQLIAMISKRHSLFERLRHRSQTKRMIMDIPIPIMVLHTN